MYGRIHRRVESISSHNLVKMRRGQGARVNETIRLVRLENFQFFGEVEKKKKTYGSSRSTTSCEHENRRVAAASTAGAMAAAARRVRQYIVAFPLFDLFFFRLSSTRTDKAHSDRRR